MEHAAELLRATATQSAAEKTEQAIVVPPVLAFPKSRPEKNARQTKLSSRDVPPTKAFEDLHAACKRLTTAEPHHKKKDPPAESAIAKRILELHDRFGGLINNEPARAALTGSAWEKAASPRCHKKHCGSPDFKVP